MHSYPQIHPHPHPNSYNREEVLSASPLLVLFHDLLLVLLYIREEVLSASPLLVLYHDLLTEAEMHFMKEKVAESCIVAKNVQMTILR